MDYLPYVSLFTLLLRIGLMLWVSVATPRSGQSAESTSAQQDNSQPGFAYNRSFEPESDDGHSDHSLAFPLMRLSGLALLVLLPATIFAVASERLGANPEFTNLVSAALLLIAVGITLWRALVRGNNA